MSVAGAAAGGADRARPAPLPADVADRDAVQRVLDGDTEAFALVVRRHGGPLVALCSRLVGDRHAGEELAQEALARAYSSLGSWRGDGGFRHWLYRIAANLCRDHLKAGARRERPTEQAGDEVPSEGHPAEELERRQLARRLQGALEVLPAIYREAFLMFHGHELAYEEMQAITGVSVSALKVRVHRARLMLKDVLGEAERAP